MSARSWRDRIAWAKANKRKPPAGFGSGSNSAHPHSWYRMCAQFVSLALGARARIDPNAGAQWDRSTKKVRVTSCRQIPAGYPVYWETSGVDDHVALKVGGLGSPLVRSTDAVTPGEADVVDGDKLTDRWGMQLLGFTRETNGVDLTRDDDPLLKHPKPVHHPKPKTRGDAADAALAKARAIKAKPGTDRARHRAAAIVALKKIPFI